MTEDTPAVLEDYFAGDFTVPVQKGQVSPGLWADIKKKLVGALCKIPTSDPSIARGGGFSHLMLDEAAYRAMLGDPAATLPPVPTPGDAPTVASVAAQLALHTGGGAHPSQTVVGFC